MNSILLVLAGALLCLSPLPATAHDLEARIRAVNQRIARTPNDAMLYIQRGGLYRKSGNLPQALEDFDEAARLQPELDAVHFARALAWLDAGRGVRALAAILRFLDAAPEHGPALLTRARILSLLGRKQSAAKAYDLAMRFLKGAQPGHYLEQARAHASLGPRGQERAIASVLEGMRRLGPIVSLTSYARELGAEPNWHAPDLANPMARGEEMQKRVLPPPPPTLLAETKLFPRGSVWRYLDDGSDQGTAWQAPVFDDSKWAFGPAQLGYGDGDEQTVVSYGPNSSNKYITTYFRHSFQITSLAQVKRARLLLLRDDGAVVYLNGTEVARSNMPATGKIDYQTTASSAVSGGEEDTFHSIPIDHRLLKTGTNVMAVEIHQANPTSSDISFDLELLGSDGLPTVVRGPYLQQGTPNSAIIRWRTDWPTETVTFLGSAPGSLSVKTSNTQAATEHEALLAGLSPDTQYYYAIGNSKGILVGGDQNHHFKTPPQAGTIKPTRIWVVGDSGTADANAAAVRDAYLGYTGTRHTDLWLMLGDNAYDSGTDSEYQGAVFDMYPAILRNTFLWPTLGNHDAISASSSNLSGVYYDLFSLPRSAEAGGVASGTEAYYSYDHGNVHLVCMNSEDVSRSTTGAMLTWLKADLAATKARWIIAYWHHPPYSKGSHDSDDPNESGGRLKDMRENVLPILEAGGVDLVLSGHSHSYERSYLLDGHYDVSSTLTPSMKLDHGNGRIMGDGAYAKETLGAGAHEGAVYVVAGSSGKVSGGTLDHRAMIISFNTLGSLVLDIDGNRLDSRFLTSKSEIKDSFTLLKGIKRTLTRLEPGIPISQGGTQNLFLDAGTVHAGRIYRLAGSLADSPGFKIGTVHIPLNIDPWFDLSLGLMNSSVFQNTGGTLDSKGRAAAAINLPAIKDPSLVGFTLYHAYVVHDSQQFVMASNAVKLTLLP